MLLQFDYKKGVLRLTNNASKIIFDENKGTKMRISKRGIADVMLVINGKKEYVEFDSGSGDFFSYKTKDAQQLKKIPEEEKLKFKGIFSYGVSSKDNIQSTIRYRPKVTSLKLGETTFTDFYSDFSKKSAPRIGASILYYGKTTLDFQNLRFYYEPYHEITKLPPFETFGFDVVYLNDRYLIKWVMEGSQAETKGLKYGLVVKAINDVSIGKNQDDCETYLNGFSFKKQDKVSIKFVNSHGELETLSLEKMKL